MSRSSEQKRAQLPSTRSIGIIPLVSLELETDQLKNPVVTGYMRCRVLSATFHDASIQPYEDSLQCLRFLCIDFVPTMNISLRSSARVINLFLL
jgi:hypothetical protein